MNSNFNNRHSTVKPCKSVSKRPYLGLKSDSFITTGVPRRPARSSRRSSFSWSAAEGISQFHKCYCRDSLQPPPPPQYMYQSEGPPSRRTFPLSFPNCPAHPWPLWPPLFPLVKWTVPGDKRSRRHGQFQLSSANSVDTPGMLICSSASPISASKYCNPCWITSSHSINRSVTNSIIHLYFFKYIATHRNWKISQNCSSLDTGFYRVEVAGHLNITR